MPLYKRIFYNFLRSLGNELVEPACVIWRAVWNRGVKLAWYRLFIRKDDQHVSLDMDVDAMIDLSPKELVAYHQDISRRRFIAHQRSFGK
jgi:hypothetical protein